MEPIKSRKERLVDWWTIAMIRVGWMRKVGQVSRNDILVETWRRDRRKKAPLVVRRLTFTDGEQMWKVFR